MRLYVCIVLSEDEMRKSLGFSIIQIAVALYLFVNGLWGLMNDKSAFRAVFTTIFGRGEFTSILTIVFSVCALIAGIFLILELLGVSFAFTDLLIMIFMIAWIVYIIFADVINPIRAANSIFGGGNWLSYLSTLSSHLMVLGGFFAVSKKFN